MQAWEHDLVARFQLRAGRAIEVSFARRIEAAALLRDQLDGVEIATKREDVAGLREHAPAWRRGASAIEREGREERGGRSTEHADLRLRRIADALAYPAHARLEILGVGTVLLRREPRRARPMHEMHEPEAQRGERGERRRTTSRDPLLAGAREPRAIEQERHHRRDAQHADPEQPARRHHGERRHEREERADEQPGQHGAVTRLLRLERATDRDHEAADAPQHDRDERPARHAPRAIARHRA